MKTQNTVFGPKKELLDIRIMSSVRQGCILSPILFVLVFDYILFDCTGFGIQTGEGKRLADLDFSDDIVLI